MVAYAAQIAAQLGANMIKVKPPTAFIEQAEAKKAYEANKVPLEPFSARIKHVIQSAFDGRRIVIFSGGRQGNRRLVAEYRPRDLCWRRLRLDHRPQQLSASEARSDRAARQGHRHLQKLKPRRAFRASVDETCVLNYCASLENDLNWSGEQNVDEEICACCCLIDAGDNSGVCGGCTAGFCGQQSRLRRRDGRDQQREACEDIAKDLNTSLYQVRKCKKKAKEAAKASTKSFRHRLPRGRDAFSCDGSAQGGGFDGFARGRFFEVTIRASMRRESSWLAMYRRRADEPLIAMPKCELCELQVLYAALRRLRSPLQIYDSRLRFVRHSDGRAGRPSRRADRRRARIHD